MTCKYLFYPCKLLKAKSFPARETKFIANNLLFNQNTVHCFVELETSMVFGGQNVTKIDTIFVSFSHINGMNYIISAIRAPG